MVYMIRTSNSINSTERRPGFQCVVAAAENDPLPVLSDHRALSRSPGPIDPRFPNSTPPPQTTNSTTYRILHIALIVRMYYVFLFVFLLKILSLSCDHGLHCSHELTWEQQHIRYESYVQAVNGSLTLQAGGTYIFYTVGAPVLEHPVQSALILYIIPYPLLRAQRP